MDVRRLGKLPPIVSDGMTLPGFIGGCFFFAVLAIFGRQRASSGITGVFVWFLITYVLRHPDGRILSMALPAHP